LPEKSLRRRVRDGVFWLTAVKIGGQLISWSITIYVMRLLSPSDYGLMAMAGVYIGFVALFNEVGLGAAIVQKKNLDIEDRSNIHWTMLLVNLGLYALSFFLAPLVAAFYSEPRVTNVIRVLSIVLVVRALGLVSNSMLSRELGFKRQSQAALLGNLSGAVSALWFARSGLGVWSLVYGNIINEVVTNLLLFLFYPWKPNLSFSLVKVKDSIHFGSKVAVARLLWYLSSNIDLLIAGKILGKTHLGYYTMAQVSFPVFSKVQDNAALLTRYYLKIVNVGAFVSFPVCWGIFLVAESAVPLFLSEKWMPSILPLQILSTVTAFRAIRLFNAPLETAVGRPEITIRNFMIIIPVLGISFFVGSSYGLKGLAYSWLAFPFVSLITTSITLKLIGLSLYAYLKEIRHPVLATLFMVFAVLLGQKGILVNYGLVPQLAGSVGLGVGSYLLYYTIFYREIFREARDLLRP